LSFLIPPNYEMILAGMSSSFFYLMVDIVTITFLRV